MAHHKRKGPKSTRAGCLLCKPHKRQGARPRDRQRFALWRALTAASLPRAGADRRSLPGLR